MRLYVVLALAVLGLCVAGCAQVRLSSPIQLMPFRNHSEKGQVTDKAPETCIIPVVVEPLHAFRPAVRVTLPVDPSYLRLLELRAIADGICRCAHNELCSIPNILCCMLYL